MNPTHSSNGSPACGPEALARFDSIIDVRTPAEFAEDHMPGAINAPVLDNAERALVGTLHAQESAFKATRVGAALVARHIAEHIETVFADKPRNWRPLVYCWRGGKRSAAMATWFNLIGWRARQLEGGYKTWRRYVMAELNTVPHAFRYIVLTGPTGSGKTRLLQALGATGAQALDLEALACHRGSLLGALPNQAQPGQKRFETLLLQALQQFDPNRPVFIEAESRRIGQVSLPDALLQGMHAGRCVRVRTRLPKRIDFLLQDYDHLFETPDTFSQQLHKLIGLHSRKTVSHWQALIHHQRKAELFNALVQMHYDPAYQRSSHHHFATLDQALVFDYDPTASNQAHQARALMQQLGLLHAEQA
ncbi:tRNA 2-selenouridine(34) synthase MnmH [Castellaniella sp.]|uniref:tRNA 2-selenouridine(34) synthase MnmH n=1 Tax=Castellaniella sp. TaxID=1955812 RepID=UPI0035635851